MCWYSGDVPQNRNLPQLCLLAHPWQPRMSMALPLPGEAILAVTVCAEPCSPLTLGNAPCAHSAPWTSPLRPSCTLFPPLFQFCCYSLNAVQAMVCPVGVGMLAAGGQVLAVVGSIKAGGGLHKRTLSGTCPFTVSLYFL